MRILLTGFEPFDGQPVNPSWAAVKQLPDFLADAELCKAELPTAFTAAEERMESLLAELQPDGVLCVGQAGGRAALTVEQVAINLRRASIPDNAGYQPDSEPVFPGGPDGLFAAWDVPGAVEAIRSAGIPAAVSYSAGTFVCNDLFYTLLRLRRERYPALQGGFIHVPFLPEQAAHRSSPLPSAALSDIVKGLEAAAAFLIREICRPRP